MDWKKNLLAFIISLVFVFVVNLKILFLGEEINWIYTILTFFIGLSVGRQVVKPEKVPRETHTYLKNLAIVVYILLYILLSCLIDWNLLPEEYTLFSFKIIFGGFFFYEGLKAIQTKKAWRRGGQLTKTRSIVSGIIAIIFSLLILFARFIFAIGDL